MTVYLDRVGAESDETERTWEARDCSLYALAVYLLYQDWTATDKLALDANNGKFQVLVPVGVVVSGVIALAWSSLRRRYFHRTLESAAAPIPGDATTTAG